MKELKGDVAAFAVEFEKYKPQLKSFLLRITASAEDTEDLLQDAFIKASQNLHNFQNRSSLKTWLFAITGNLAKTFFAQKNTGQTTSLISRDRVNYGWSITKTAIIFGALIGFLWDGLQGGMIEVATFKMPSEVFWVDSGYHTIEGVIAMLTLSLFYKRFVLGKANGRTSSQRLQ